MSQMGWEEILTHVSAIITALMSIAAVIVSHMKGGENK